MTERVETLVIEIGELRDALLEGWRRNMSVWQVMLRISDAHGVLRQKENGFYEGALKITSAKGTAQLHGCDKRPIRAWLGSHCPRVSEMLFDGRDERSVRGAWRTIPFRRGGKRIIPREDAKEWYALTRTRAIPERSRSKRHDWNTVK